MDFKGSFRGVVFLLLIINVIIVLIVFVPIMISKFVDKDEPEDFYNRIDEWLEESQYFEDKEESLLGWRLRQVPGTYFFGLIDTKFDRVDTVIGVSLRYIDEKASLIEIKIIERGE